jgi:hypothetical protein
MTEHPKPIEGHLADLGYNPARLDDEEREEIAMAIINAYAFGTGIITFNRYPTGNHRFECQDVTDVQIRVRQ